MVQPPAKKNRKELITDVWANVCDILLEQKLDKTAVALGSTSTELHHLVLPKLYNTVRIRNSKALMLFIYGCEESPYKPPPPVRVLDARTLVRHVEIECEPDLWEFQDTESWDVPHPLHRIQSCHIRTIDTSNDEEDDDEDDTDEEDEKLTGYLDFVVFIMRQIPTEHVKWEHSRLNDNSMWAPTPSSKRAKVLRDPKIKSIAFPFAWQLVYDDRDPTPVLINARIYGHMLTAYWYTNPNGNETPGQVCRRLHEEKSKVGAVKKKPMYIVQIAQQDPPSSRSSEDEWHEKEMDRRSAGTLSDFAVMEKMGLIDVKVVSVPDLWEPQEWRKWILGEGLKPGNGVEEDLRAIAK
jgi:hypothetical protein